MLGRLMSLSFIITLLSCPRATAQMGSWRAYMSYAEPQQIVKASNLLFVRASNDLYSYNLNDHSITTYDKVTTLNDTYISHIAWNQVASKLIIVYQNGNMDLMDINGNVNNISALYAKSMTRDKTVNSVYMNNNYAYLTTGFGVVKVNMKRSEIAETYILNENIVSVGIDNNMIYVLTADGNVLAGPLSANLIDFHNWSEATAPDGIFTTNTTDWDTYLSTVSTLNPGGPRYNHFNYLTFTNNKLYSCGGGWRDGTQYFRPGCAQIMDRDENWLSITDIQPLYGKAFMDATAIVTDRNDENTVYISTCGTGLYKVQNGQMVKNYTEGNSPLMSSAGDDPDYVRVEGLIYDNNGLLWMSCSSQNSKKNILLNLNTQTEEWKTFDSELLYNNGNRIRILRNSIVDANGNIWMGNDHHDFACLIKINPTTGNISRFSNFTNQDGTTYVFYGITAMAMDLEHNIWIGTDKGLFLYDATQQEDPEQGFTQIKVPRNDGSNYADYLMNGVYITSIAIDGANRKWIGTDGEGIYLISADNMEQLQHFTIENSKLISNTIESIAIDNSTGRVFIGTNMGLCSYDADATEAAVQMSKNDVYAYPNPVKSDYNGLITIVGLSFDADVKILTVNGQLVAQGRSNGGTFTWNGRDSNGRRVASGVYMVATATTDGKKGTVCKIAIVK